MNGFNIDLTAIHSGVTQGSVWVALLFLYINDFNQKCNYPKFTIFDFILVNLSQNRNLSKLTEIILNHNK